MLKIQWRVFLSAANNSKIAPLKDRLIPWYFVIAFLIVFTVNGFFVYMAIRTNHGVVTENAYEKGLEYNAIVKKVQAQKLENTHAAGTNTP